MRLKRAVIFANGEIPNDVIIIHLLDPQDFFIAADGGAQHLLRLKIIPNLVVGDLDSMHPSVRDRLLNQKVEVQDYETEKNETDLELALQAAYDKGFQDILVIGGFGGRLDQLIGNLALLLNPRWGTCRIIFDDGKDKVLLIRNEETINGKVGDPISLIPWMDNAFGITTTGLKYALENADLLRHKTRGISNYLIDTTAKIKIKEGTLLCIHSRGKRNKGDLR